MGLPVSAVNPQSTQEALRASTLVGVVRSRDAARARAIFTGLLEGGLRALEVTANTPGAFELIAAHAERAHRAGVVLGVGTVRTAAELDAAADAGARFVVSPHTDPARIAEAKQRGLVAIPGAFTPTEILAARAAGADFVKVFPVSAGGGAAYVRLLRGPLPDVPLWVSGDVRLDEIPGYLDAGASLLGLTSVLDPGPQTEDVLGAARARAGAALEALARAREGAPLLTIHAGGQAFSIGLKEIRRLPGAEHTALEAVVRGRRGAAVRMRRLLAAAGVPEQGNLRIVSTDGFSRELGAQAVYEQGFLHWATDGHPLEAAEGGPLRLYVVGGDDQCDNVKGLSEIHVLT